MGACRSELNLEELRRDAEHSMYIDPDVLVEVIDRLAAAEEGLFRVVVAIGEDTDGARTARDYFGPLTVLVRDQPPITDPVGITLHLVSEYRREMEQEADIADARVAAAERERADLRREMHDRELHHFEEEQRSAGLAAVIEKIGLWRVTDGSEGTLRHILSAAPADALAEHDRLVAERTWDECLAEIEENEINTQQAREGNPYRKEQENNDA